MRALMIGALTALVLAGTARTAESQLLSAGDKSVAQISPVVPAGGATVLRFVLNGELRDTTTALSAPLLDAVQRISQVNSFRQLDLASRSFSASFAFTSDAEFRQWYTSSATVQMLSEVRNLTRLVNYRLLISHFPAEGHLPLSRDSAP